MRAADPERGRLGRFPADVEVAWRRFEDTERLEELLPLLVTYQESEAFSE